MHFSYNSFLLYLKKHRTASFSLAALLFGSAALIWNIIPPSNFPAGSIITIKQGDSLKEVADFLEKNNIVKSALLFRACVILFNKETSIASGDYYFDRSEPACTVAHRLVTANRDLARVKITIPEGTSVYEIADILKQKFADFNVSEFGSYAVSKEGYLFPDTYYISRLTPPKDIVSLMVNNFNRKMLSAAKDIAAFGRSVNDVVTMASILEEEANTSESRRMIAGILWKRLDAGMPLQVDVSFQKINGKGSRELTMTDLATSSPFNTYTNKGLPPTPITNPGMDAILAAVHPTPSPYWYFLSDRKGKMHYATTFDQHKVNKAEYGW